MITLIPSRDSQSREKLAGPTKIKNTSNSCHRHVGLTGATGHWIPFPTATGEHECKSLEES